MCHLIFVLRRPNGNSDEMELLSSFQYISRKKNWVCFCIGYYFTIFLEVIKLDGLK